MANKHLWIIPGVFLALGIFAMTSSELAAQRERDFEKKDPRDFGGPPGGFPGGPPGGPGGFGMPPGMAPGGPPVGRYQVARVGETEIIILDTTTGELYAAGPRDVKAFTARPRVPEQPPIRRPFVQPDRERPPFEGKFEGKKDEIREKFREKFEGKFDREGEKK